MSDSFVAAHIHRELRKRKVEFNRTMKEISSERKTLAILDTSTVQSDLSAAVLIGLLQQRDNLSAEIFELKRNL